MPLAVAEVALTARDFVFGNLLVLRFSPLRWIFGLWLLTGLANVIQTPGLGLGLIGMATGVLALVGLASWAQYRRLPEDRKRYTWRFFEDRIETWSSVASAELKWQVFPRVIETRSLFLFFLQGPLCHVVPKRAFHDDSQIAAVRRLAKASLGPKAKVREP